MSDSIEYRTGYENGKRDIEKRLGSLIWRFLLDNPGFQERVYLFRQIVTPLEPEKIKYVLESLLENHSSRMDEIGIEKSSEKETDFC